MKRVLVTGMSGTGKSSVIRKLAESGYRAIDTDWNPEWEIAEARRDGPGWRWREDRIRDLLHSENGEVLFVSACVENQGKFYPSFDHIVLLSAAEQVTVERLTTRAPNPYGKRPDRGGGSVEVQADGGTDAQEPCHGRDRYVYPSRRGGGQVAQSGW